MANASLSPRLQADVEALDGLLTRMGLGAMLVDAEGRLRWANRVFMEMGVCRQALANLDPITGVALDPVVCRCCALGGECARGEHSELIIADEREEERVPNVYGIVAYPLRDENDAPYLLHVLRDVSQVEQAKKDRHELFLMLANVLDNTVDAVLTLDPENRIHSWNYGAWQLFGYSKEEARGRSLDFLIPDDPESRDTYYALLRELDEQGFVRHRHVRMRTKDRRTLDVALTQTTMRNPAGEPLGHSLIIRDVTDIVRLERDRAEKVEQLSRFLEMNQIVRGLKDIDEIYRDLLVAITAGDSRRFSRVFLLMVNRDTARLGGVRVVGPWSPPKRRVMLHDDDENQSPTLAELLRAWEAADHQLDEAATEAFRKVVVSLGDRTHPLVRCLHDNRPYLYVAGGPDDDKLSELVHVIRSEHFVAVPLVWLNRQLGVILADNADSGQYITADDMQYLASFANHAASAIANIQLQNDLTAKVAELQKAYQATTEIQRESARKEKLATLGAVASKVAHEMRNPLAIMGGFARLLEKSVTTEPARKHLSVIISETMRLERILNQVLDMGRPVQLDKQPHNINETLNDLVYMTDKQREELGIHLHLRLDPSLPTIECNQDSLKQAFLNIIRNALEAMGRDGILTIETRTDEPEWVVAMIRDTGVGIEPETLEKLFQPFVTTKARGVGLGLSITRQVIEQQNGKISVSSKPGAGTTFEIRFPLRQKEVDHDAFIQKETADRG